MNVALLSPFSLLEKMGQSVLRLFEYWGNILFMIAASVRAAVFDRSHAMRETLRVIAAQTYFTGWQAMPLILVVAFATGSLITFYSANQANPLGSGDVGSSLLYLVVGRELGPLIVGFVVIARSGTAVASELGNMRANGEIDALSVMGINPLSFIVFPRLIAGVLSVVCLVLYFDFVAIAGGFLTSNLFHEIPVMVFITSFVNQVQGEDVCIVFLKAFLMGAAIFSASSYQGLQVKKSHHEVPQVTTKAVVVNIVSVTLINFVLTTVMLIRLMQGGVQL